MAKTIELDVTRREAAGKGAARAARREGLVPGVIYGGGKDP
ncbi:MAG: 50S ribosomal protein L25, partial [Pseudomonadota bacterium]